MIVPLLALALAIPHHQAAPTRIPVVFTCTCKDSLSRLYATKVRDLLALSPRYMESPAGDGVHYEISVATVVDDGEASSPASVALSIAILNDGFLLSHGVHTCGSTRIDSCADYTMSYLDAEVHR